MNGLNLNQVTGYPPAGKYPMIYRNNDFYFKPNVHYFRETKSIRLKFNSR